MGSNKAKYLRSEDVAEHVRPYVDFDSQRLEARGEGDSRDLYVSVQCPDCGEWRRLKVAALRGRRGRRRHKSARCQRCAARRAKRLRPEEVDEHICPYVDFDSQKLGGPRKDGRRTLRVSIQCPDCGEWREVDAARLRKTVVGCYQSTRCGPCRARKTGRNQSVHGDWHANDKGYREIGVSWLEGNDRELAEGMRSRAVLEHRLVAARCLGRPLETGEQVHHLDGAKDNNVADNLAVVSCTLHAQLTLLEHAGTMTRFEADGTPYTVRARVVFDRVD